MDSNKANPQQHKSKAEQQRQAKGPLKQDVGLRCKACGASNAAGALYCEECGVRLGAVTKCPRCAAPIDGNAEVCEVCGKWLAVDKCRFCGGHLAQGEKFCSDCATPVDGILCPACRKISESEFCQHCSTPLTAMAKKAVQAAAPAKEKMSQLMRDVQNLQVRTSLSEMPKAAQSEEENKRQREGLRALEGLMKEAKAKRKEQLKPVKSEKRTALFTKEESELMQKKAELRKQMEEQSEITFKTTQEARRYFQAVKPPNALGWICNYKTTVHPSPDGCAHPEHGGHWELFTDITWVSTTEDV